MKALVFVAYLFAIGIDSIDSKQVIKDFTNDFDNSRFASNVTVITEDHEESYFDTTIITHPKLKKQLWKKINLIYGRCDYLVNIDSASINSFNVTSNKAYTKFWIKYNAHAKIKIIRITKPMISMHLIPPPCGY